MAAVDARKLVEETASRAARGAGRLPVLIPVALICAYRVAVRPFLIGSCKFCPSCSEYAIEALQRHGLWRGARLAAGRLCRCHPFSPGGIDPVPGPKPTACPEQPAA